MKPKVDGIQSLYHNNICVELAKGNPRIA